MRERLAEVFDIGAQHEGTDATEAALVWTPPVDVAADDKVVIASFEVPGMGAEDVVLELRGSVLTVRGERTRSEARVSIHRIERSMGRFERSVQLPVSVDGSRCKARLDRGVLLVHLPRGSHASEGVMTIAVAGSVRAD